MRKDRAQRSWWFHPVTMVVAGGLVMGRALCGVGLFAMANAASPMAFTLSAGVCIGIALGVMAAALHYPINDRAILRPGPLPMPATS